MDEPNSHILLILDLDETLIHAREEALPQPHDFVVGPFAVYKRPHLEQFLLQCSQCFEIAFWSSASEEYVRQVVTHILPPGINPAFVWARNRCTRRFNWEEQEEIWAKDLKKVKRIGRELARVLIVEDTPEKVRRHYGNAIYVHPFTGNQKDQELKNLAAYLLAINGVTNVRVLEKRNWRSRTP